MERVGKELERLGCLRGVKKDVSTKNAKKEVEVHGFGYRELSEAANLSQEEPPTAESDHFREIQRFQILGFR